MPAQEDPKPKRKPEGDTGSSKPTQDRPAAPKFDIPQQGPDHLPAAPQPEQPRHEPSDRPRRDAPNLDSASGAETRGAAAGAGAGIPGEMRDMLNRLNRLDRPGDISDEEARRLAGLHADDGNPEPVRPDNLPALVSRDLANISRELDAGGMVVPKWHSIKHLPGFQAKQVRGMGQDIFSMFTRTPHHEIKTIANMGGHGPNTEREVKAVLAWLRDNADELPEAHLDYSQAGMGGYQPRVKEYSTNNTRFHVVQDQAGWYIYAYPEQDAVEHGAPPALGHSDSDSNEPERDEFGALIPKRLKEGTQMKFTSLSEQMRHLANTLDDLQRTTMFESFNQEILEMMLDESTLSKMIGTNPGGQSLVRYLHTKHKLGNFAEYEEVPLSVKNVAVSIKRNKDNFAICLGTNGVAAVKPVEQDWDQSRNPERDGTMRYILVWATQDNPAEQEIRKFRFGRTDATGGASGMEGGAPNIFQVIRDRIGPMQAFYRAPEAVERSKIKGREDLKKPTITVGGKVGNPEQTTDPETGEQSWTMKGEPGQQQDVSRTYDKIAGRFKQPIQRGNKQTTIFTHMLQQTLGDITPQIQRAAAGANFQAVEKLTKAGAELQNIATALDTANPNWNARPLHKLTRLIQSAVDKMTQGDNKAETLQKLNAGDAQQLMTLLNHVREQLYSIHNIY